MAIKTLPPLPTSRQAVVQSAKNPGSFEIETRPLPVPSPTQILIKVAAVALNHCDWKMPGRVPCPGAVDGGDYSGTVVRLGETAALTSGLKIGDRVAGAQMASSRRRPWVGAFTSYIVEEADCCWLVPENLSWEEAASLPGTPETPILDPKFVLVYGGATASGTFAIQLLKLQVIAFSFLNTGTEAYSIAFFRSGYRVITTCSPKNFKLVEDYGAEKAFDYHLSTCGEEIRAYTNNTLEYALDIITEARTIRQCYAAIGRGGGKYCGFELLPEDLIATMRKFVKADWVLGLEMTGLEIDLPGGYYRKENPELHAWFVDWMKRYAALLAEEKIKPHPIKVNKGGLPKVIEGVEAMRQKEISGVKMVYPMYT